MAMLNETVAWNTAPVVLPAFTVPDPPSDTTLQSHWYAAHVCSRHEKQVARQLEERRVDCFLPLYRSIRRWKDRRKELDLVLFPGYVFVHIDLNHRLRVL